MFEGAVGDDDPQDLRIVTFDIAQPPLHERGPQAPPRDAGRQGQPHHAAARPDGPLAYPGTRRADGHRRGERRRADRRSTTTASCCVERDGNGDGTAAPRFKKVFVIDTRTPGSTAATCDKTLLVDLMAVPDPQKVGNDGDFFRFPFNTIESVHVVDDHTILVANDNNYPFSNGRAREQVGRPHRAAGAGRQRDDPHRGRRRRCSRTAGCCGRRLDALLTRPPASRDMPGPPPGAASAGLAHRRCHGRRAGGGAGASWRRRLGWHGADTPNVLFRIELFREAGFTRVGRRLVRRPLTPRLQRPAAAARRRPRPDRCWAGPAPCSRRRASTGCCARPRRTSAAGRRAASLLFAAGTVTNVAVGRLAFALGLALGLAAVLAGRRERHWWLAGGLSVGDGVGQPGRRRRSWPWRGLAWVLGARRTSGERVPPIDLRRRHAGATGAARPAVPRGRGVPVRAGGARRVSSVPARHRTGSCSVPHGSGAADRRGPLRGWRASAAFVLPTPLGANVTRLGMYVLAPVLVAIAPRAAASWLLVVAGRCCSGSGRRPSTRSPAPVPIRRPRRRTTSPCSTFLRPARLRSSAASRSPSPSITTRRRTSRPSWPSPAVGSASSTSP